MNLGGMTTTSLIVLNSVLAAAVVVGVLRLLVHGIRSDGLVAAASVEAPAGDADALDRLAV
jgi:hypothetical protein